MSKWLSGGSREDVTVRSLDTLQDVHANEMNAHERRSLFQSWNTAIIDVLEDQLMVAFESYNKAKVDFDRIRNEHDLQTLRQAEVIGVTTSGLARNLGLLQRLNVRVLVCEEAGEVLEAHLLSALLPSVEHAILIGDHEQLRPRVQNYELSCENQAVALYDLDISLFERLVRSNQVLSQPVPYCTLEVQRRMHPMISQLIRKTLYPRLQDSGAVSEYPVVPGMRERLFWMHHEQAEDQKVDMTMTSQSNEFESQMIAAIVSHLLKQGVYKAKDIAVITPYVGQLRKLRERLKRTYEIVLDERDQEELDLDGVHVDQDALTAPKREPARSTLLQALRLATVDNFQGEESKVIIVSLVRSNSRNNPGFLRTTNRINVLLSRAQHGMFILGNSKTMSTVQMWADVLNIFVQDGLFGDSLPLCCPRHESNPISVKDPDDFLIKAAEGGCDLTCEQELDCGHTCAAKCHSEMLHNTVQCMKACGRPMVGCSHTCPMPCSAQCAPRCTAIVSDISVLAPCGHEYTSLPCDQYQDPSQIRCSILKKEIVPGCGHKVTVPCFVDVTKVDYRCTGGCGAELPCGHSCLKQCSECNRRDSCGELAEPGHGKCMHTCGREYSTCNHRCESACHGDNACPPCKQACEVRCSHSRCKKMCYEPCAPCSEESCASRCPHSACQMPCAAPCDWQPCSLRCIGLLDCGCQCPSMCGEICPSADLCQNCAAENVRSQKADLLGGKLYGEVDLDEDPCIFTDCGHIFTTSSLDRIMDMQRFYEFDARNDGIIAIKSVPDSPSFKKLKACPRCRGSLRSIARYGRILRQEFLDENAKSLASLATKALHKVANVLSSAEKALSESIQSCLKPRQDICIAGPMNELPTTIKDLETQHRYDAILRLRQSIIRVSEHLERERQPHHRLKDMVVKASHRSDANNIGLSKLNSSSLQHCAGLQASLLYIRCQGIIVSDIVKMHMETPISARGSLKVDLAVYREKCDLVMRTAESSINIREEIEAHILWAELAALEDCLFDDVTAIRLGESDAKVQDRQEHAQVHLDLAEMLCLQLPGSTAALDQEIKDKRRMLDKRTPTSELKTIFPTSIADVDAIGHWHKCANDHLFYVGGNDVPTDQMKCPSCGQGIGRPSNSVDQAVSRSKEESEWLDRMAKRIQLWFRIDSLLGGEYSG